MLVEIGHTAGIDHDGASMGNTQRVTSFVIPDEVGTSEAFTAIQDAVTYHLHLDPGQSPAWIKSENSAVQTLLLSHFNMNPKHNTRPRSWGKVVQ